MQWQPVAEGPDERTEVYEIAGRGSLVRIVVRGADDRWTPASMCFCPGVRATELGGQAPTPAAAPVAAARTEPSVQSAEAPAATPPPLAAPPAEPQPDASAEDVLKVLREYAVMRNAVIGAFRSKVGVSSGVLGFLDNVPKVGTMIVPGQGDWVWRIDTDAATLRSKNKVVRLNLPDHARDDAFDGALLAGYMTLTHRTQVGHEGMAYPIDAVVLDRLINQLEQAKLVRVFSKNPTPLFILK
jgi:hypothetical protein